MHNVFEFPWEKAYKGSPTTRNDRLVNYRALYRENIRAQTKPILNIIDSLNIPPHAIIKIVDEEKPATTLASYDCWILTQSIATLPKARKLGSSEPTTYFNSYRGFALASINLLFEYVALEENIANKEVIHFDDVHLVDEIPESYIKLGTSISSDLTIGIDKLSRELGLEKAIDPLVLINGSR